MATARPRRRTIKMVEQSAEWLRKRAEYYVWLSERFEEIEQSRLSTDKQRVAKHLVLLAADYPE